MRTVEKREYKGKEIKKVKDRALNSGYAWMYGKKIGSLKDMKNEVDKELTKA